MGKVQTKRPVIIMLYGFPGSGKTFFARNVCKSLQAVHLSDDRIRGELFEKPRYDKAENSVVSHLIEYMAGEFLNTVVSVVIDVDTRKSNYRRHIRELAAKHRARTIVLWFQIDAEASFARLDTRDRRKHDDKFSRTYSKQEFETYAAAMQHPTEKEDFVVLSGKHSFLMQQSTLLRRFYDWGLVSSQDVSRHVVKPGLMSLIPSNDPNNRKLHIR